MCVVSIVFDHYHDKWGQQQRDWLTRQPPYVQPTVTPLVPQIPAADVVEFYKLLERAREYDKRNNEPDCELESKKEKLRALAEQMGVKIEFA